jgi:hypothetical protein
MAVYCTYFDHRYLVRGLALYQSLVDHANPSRLYILCLSQLCFQILLSLKLPNVYLLTLDDLEQADPELAATRDNRSLVEYYFTCTPALLMHLFRTEGDIDTLTYLDADLFFFANPAPILDEIGDRSIGIVPHRYPPALAHMADSHGKYNVGWLTFRRDERAAACLSWWRSRCLEWCYDRVEDGKYADQKYLDAWPERFPGTAIIQHAGANLAPWNLPSHRLTQHDGRVLVDGQPLIFFHFHRLREIRPWLYAPRLTDFGARATPLVRSRLYVPYLRTLRSIHRTVQPLLPTVRVMDSARQQTEPLRRPGLPGDTGSGVTPARILEAGRRLLVREYFIFVNDRVI